MAEPGGTRSKRKADCLDPDPDLGYSESSKRLKTQAATPIYEDGISSGRFLSIHSIVCRHVSADKETVQKDKDLFNESPASTAHEQEERSPHPLPDEDDRKHDKDFDGKDKDSAIETPAATTPINEPEEARSKVDLAFRSMCATIALNYYNNNYKTKFELVEALDGYLPDSSGSRIHCHFNAKEYDDSINKFFAEIHLLDLAVTTCKILDGETKVGAKNRKFIYQPVDYYFGSYYFNSSLRHPISDDEEVNLKRSTRIVIRDEEYARKHKSPDYKRDRREFWTRVYQQQCKEDANLALAYYNEQNHTKYKLVEDYEIMESNPIYDIAGNFVHCFFEASDGSSSSKFFAEIPIVQDASILPSVTTCKVLVEGQTKDCGHCDFIHPVDGCQAPSAPREMSYDADMELDQVPMNSDELRYWRCSTSPGGDTGDSYCPTSPSYEQGCSWYNPSYETTTSGETKVGSEKRKFIYQPVVEYLGAFHYSSYVKHLVSDDEEVNLQNSKEIVITHEVDMNRSPDFQRDEEEFWRKVHHEKCMKYANLALAYYNQKNCTKFKLVDDYETMDSNHIYDISGKFIHCLFKANEGSSSSEFFAEIQNADDYPIPPSVSTCERLIEGKTRAGCGCEFCDFVHPVDGYLASSVPPAMKLDEEPIDDSKDVWYSPDSPTWDPRFMRVPTSPTWEYSSDTLSPNYYNPRRRDLE